ncbi:TPA: terminase family protein [Yersinia enterocolitica]|nr:terminase family protein [Yersinia enterocolitica]HDL7781846.1 terminase family protein [Yersinia enterocolitica]HDL7786245.1 terminase family protein [Yersinia enterocolitica]HDL8501978.1 terminase family protein [Yersinia enterocolitica]HDV0802488.1 terminase family protein [Yersinia enterocolitica]
MAKHSQTIIGVARSLYLQRWTPKEIANELNLPNARIIYYWAQKWHWADMLSHESIEEAINRRILVLANRDNKNELELKEVDSLIAQHCKLMAQKSKHAEKLAAIKAQTQGSYASGEEAGARDENGGGKRKYRKNDISGIQQEELELFAGETLFFYQQYLRANKHHAIRNILKSRQIGATWYFSFEALEDAIISGAPQIFLSASRAQAEVFRSYIVNIAQQFFGVTLTGNPIRLSNGAELRFLSTNKNTAQSYSGHLYCDEYLWVPNFAKLNEAASAMATHDKWRTTYFSTPSAKTHQGYPFWTGEEWKQGDKQRSKITFPEFDEYRDGGRLCPDGQWRYVITLEDAIDGGFNLANIERLRNKYNRDTFNMLYMCVFVDSGDSVFKFHMLEKCGVDIEMWQDHDFSAPRPFGNREVWGGFDPARSGDTSTFVIIAPPQFEGERFRVLATFYWQGLNFNYQANQIKELFQRYNMTYIGVDITGIGNGVFELVQNFAMRQAVAIHYGLESKNRLVMKMVDVIESQRLEWDAEAKEIPASFLAIRRTSTAKGGGMTFVADRTKETGHADVFWAISHAIDNEPLNFEHKRKSTWKTSKAA